MGTSASGGGAQGSNPLIPSWISEGGSGTPPIPPPPQQEGPENPQDGPSESDPQTIPAPDRRINSPTPIPDHSNNEGRGRDDTTPSNGTRYRQPRRDFNTYVKSGGRNTGSLNKALREYSRRAAGNTQNLAKRMQPSSSRVAIFYETINGFKNRGKTNELASLNLSSYQNKPLIEILSSLTDIIFRDTGKIYEDTQDDSITKHAYANTIVRITELEGIDLDNLTNDQIAVMTSMFIEETIAQRVISDIGDSLTKKNTNISVLITLEDSIYQIVSGLVRTTIMPQIMSSQLGNQADLNSNIENIYRIAFDTIAGIN